MTGAGRPTRVLVVCTGNLNRSPLAERLLAERTRHLPVAIESAGTLAQVGDRMREPAAALLRREGIEPGGFRSRRVSVEMVASADVILTATRRHVDRILELDPGALRRTATLVEFALWSDGTGASSVDEAISRALGRRGAGQPTGLATCDIPDPEGLGEAAYGDVWRLVDAAVSDLVRAWTAAAAAGASDVRGLA